jgi:hypothetical protein
MTISHEQVRLQPRHRAGTWSICSRTRERASDRSTPDINILS